MPSIRKKLLRRFLNWWPPFLGAGIVVEYISPDFRAIDVRMRLSWWNANYVGVHFGGSLYAMTDPFFMLMIMENLGSEYVVWDKAAEVRFKRPGRRTVRARFRISLDEIDRVRAEAEKNWKVEPQYTVLVVDEEGTVIAEVVKTIYVRKKNGEGSPNLQPVGD